ncbi:MAG: hypothetical protein AB1757_08650 [Acidobacteriota bacterium]
MLNEVLKICEAIRDAGGRAMLVGGIVRDRLFGYESKDYDLEVYYLEPALLRSTLESFGHVNTVGEHFAVYKLTIYVPSSETNSKNVKIIPKSAIRNPQSAIVKKQRVEIDVSIPRRESKSGRGHRGFVITGDPHMTFAEAARRRDFTINAIMQDPLTDEIVDPYGGVADIENRIIRAIAADTFIEDSLRVLRAMQIAARFEMTIAPETIALCRTIDLSDLPHERIWGEFEKLFLRAAKPSIGLHVALELGVLEKLFPPLYALTKNPRANELTAFTKTQKRLDAGASQVGELAKEKHLTLMLAALCLDLSVEQAIDVLDTLSIFTINNYDVRKQVLALVSEHQKPIQFFESREQTTDGDFRRLAGRVEMNLLYHTVKADLIAGGDKKAPAAKWFIEKVRQLDLQRGAPEPILMGRHLREIGIQPGPQMGKLLHQVYELQLDGVVQTLEQALEKACSILANQK